MGFEWGGLWAAGGLAGLGWLVTWTVRRYAYELGLLHVPNARSSHVGLIPHGGGLGIVVAAVVAATGLHVTDSSQGQIMIGLAILIALLGLWDDIRSLAIMPRLAVHALVIAVAVVWLGDVPSMVGFLLLLMLGVWWINLFNFMDGIDGLAAVQALFMLLIGAMLAVYFMPHSIQSTTWRWMWFLAAGIGGFLLHNWPPAKIFMGDVGSTFLGFVLFALALVSHREGWLPYSVWLILGGVFVVDSTVTLLSRIYFGEKWYEGHRTHAYQQLARDLGGHRPVTLLAIVANLGFLTPLAFLVMARPDLTWLGLDLAYGALIIGVLLVRYRHDRSGPNCP